MLLKVNQQLKTYEGKPLKEGDKDVYLRTVLVNALNYTVGDKSTADEKLSIYKICLNIMTKEEVDISIELLALAKKNVNVMYAPLIVGQVVLFLDGARPNESEKGKEEKKVN